MTKESMNTQLATVNAGQKPKSRKLVVTLIAVGAVASVAAVACGGGGHPSPKMMQRMLLGQVDDLADDIDATDAQRAVFESTAQAIFDDALAMKKDHEKDKKEMIAVLSAPSVDREAVKTNIQEKLDRLEAFLLHSADQVIDAYETLDDGQRQILIDKLAEHMENH